MILALRIIHRSCQNLYIPSVLLRRTFRISSSSPSFSFILPPATPLIMKQSKISSFFTKRPASSNPDVDEHASGSRKKSKTTEDRSDDEDATKLKSKSKRTTSSSKSRSKSSVSPSKPTSPKPEKKTKDAGIKKKRAVIYSSEEEDEPKGNASDRSRSKSRSPSFSPVKKSPLKVESKSKSPSVSPERKKTPESKAKSPSPSPKKEAQDSRSNSKSPPTKVKDTDSKSKSKSSANSKVSAKSKSTTKKSASKTKASAKKSSNPVKSKKELNGKTKKESKSDSEEEVVESVFTESDEEVDSKPKTNGKGTATTCKTDPETPDSNEKKVDKSPSASKSFEIVSASSKNKSPTSKLPSVKGWDNDYNPASSKYHPIDDASWKRGQRVPYMALAKTLEKIEETSSRLKNIEILANYFRSVILLSPEDLRFSVYLCLNKLAPAYEGVELGIADTNLMKAIAQATGRALGKIKEDAAARGDLGLVAESSRSNQKTLFTPAPLTVAGVFAKLKEIAALTGQASTLKKIGMIQSMLVACKYSEARYLIRSLAGKLRIGLAEQSLLQALAQACYLTPPNQNQTDPDVEWPPKKKLINAGSSMQAEKLKAEIEKVAFELKSSYCECPNYDILVNALLKDGLERVEKHCQLTPGIPPRPMLAQPTKGIEDILERFTGINFTCEYKYDGERAQIHLLEDGRVQVYSRNQENNTSKYPEIVSRFKDCLKPEVKSCIVDSEAVAWDRENEAILPFQVLSTRKRKDANEAEIKVQVYIFAFDLIYLNGENLAKEPLARRRELLRENFDTVTGQFGFATSLDTDSMEHVQEFLDESIKGNCEGLMVKTLDVNATYELAKRSQKWLKLKKDYLATGGDSLDLVVIGGFLGKGKRTGGYGGFLLACYDPENEEFQTICKLGTGFSDEDLEKHSESLKSLIIPKPKPYYQFHSNLTPDHWFDAVQVWEVKCADLSLSPVHKAAVGIEDPERGISLRFPRFLRIREDKNSEDATSASQVAQMYKNQEVVKTTQGNKKPKAGADEDDFY